MLQTFAARCIPQYPSETPFFVSQGTGLEQFSAVTNEMKQLATKRYQELAVATQGQSKRYLICGDCSP